MSCLLLQIWPYTECKTEKTSEITGNFFTGFEELKPLKVKNNKFVRLFAAILHIVCVNLKLWLPQVNKNAKKKQKKNNGFAKTVW